MVEIKREVVFPNELATDPDQDSLAVYVANDQGLYASASMVRSFESLDRLYSADKAAYLGQLASSVDILRTEYGSLNTAFLHGEHDAQSENAMMVFSPLNDGKPAAPTEELIKFVHKDTHSVTDEEIRRAQPNSARPLIKLSLGYYYGQLEGLGMPHYQLFAREAPAFNHAERRRVTAGDTRPYGRLAVAGFEDMRRQIHETYGYEGPDGLHMFAAGMGTKALGAAIYILENRPDINLRSVTIQNTPMGEKNAVRHLSNYMQRRTVGPASELVLPKNYRRVEEPLALRNLGQKAEPEMRRRQIRAMMNTGMLFGLQIKTGKAASYVERLLDAGVIVAKVDSINESMTQRTETLMPLEDTNFHRTWIVGVDGKKPGMHANEQGGVIAQTTNLGPRAYALAKAA